MLAFFIYQKLTHIYYNNATINMSVDIENICGNNTRHSNNHKQRFYTDKEYAIVSAEMLQQIPSLKTPDDINKFQKYIQRTHKISLSKANLIYFYNSLGIDNLPFKKLITKKNLNLILV